MTTQTTYAKGDKVTATKDGITITGDIFSVRGSADTPQLLKIYGIDNHGNSASMLVYSDHEYLAKTEQI